MKLDKSYKVRVTPEQSRKIQELALELGFEWRSSRKKVMYENEPYLFLNSLSEDKFFGAMDNEFEFDVHKFTEIQADDLITLLTELPKSAENPLQNIELTPEFEAVEPVLVDNCKVNIQDSGTDILDTNADIKDTPKFKVGDPVYWGLKSRIFKIHRFMSTNVLEVELDGAVTSVHKDELCPATLENYGKLCSLFECIDFEQPPTQADIDNEAVDKLAQAMKNKLAKKREQGYHGWETCKHGDLVQLLINHVDKGDPIDVANFCAFLFARGEQLTQGGTR